MFPVILMFTVDGIGGIIEDVQYRFTNISAALNAIRYAVSQGYVLHFSILRESDMQVLVIER